MAEMEYEARDAGTSLETGKCDLIDRYCDQPHQRHPQSVMVKQRNAEQCQTEQDKIDWDTAHAGLCNA
jgi:hypothetical protein